MRWSVCHALECFLCIAPLETTAPLTRRHVRPAPQANANANAVAIAEGKGGGNAQATATSQAIAGNGR